MKKLDLVQMESLQAGFPCWVSAGLFAASVAGLVTLGPVTGGASWVAAGSAVAGFVGGSVGFVQDCRK